MPYIEFDWSYSKTNFCKENIFLKFFLPGDQGPGSVRIEIKPVLPPDGNEIEEDSENKDGNWRSQSQRQLPKPMVDPQVVQEFLLGRQMN